MGRSPIPRLRMTPVVATLASLSLLLILVLSCRQTEQEGVELLCELPERFDLSDGTGEPFRVIAWLDGRLTNGEASAKHSEISLLSAGERAERMEMWARSVGVRSCPLAEWYRQEARREALAP